VASRARVAFVLWGNDPYQQAQGAWFKTAAESGGAKVTLINGKTDPVTQANPVSDLVAGGHAGIAWQPVDAKAAINPAKQIRAEYRLVKEFKVPNCSKYVK
jgi:ABC-type sugar transport system substrate-binding protein